MQSLNRNPFYQRGYQQALWGYSLASVLSGLTGKRRHAAQEGWLDAISKDR
jgi:hypothetical protein